MSERPEDVIRYRLGEFRWAKSLGESNMDGISAVNLAADGERICELALAEIRRVSEREARLREDRGHDDELGGRLAADLRLLLTHPAVEGAAHGMGLEVNRHLDEWFGRDDPALAVGVEPGYDIHARPGNADGETLQTNAAQSAPVAEEETEQRVGRSLPQWFIERGQGQGQTPTVWLENSASHPGSHKRWTTDADHAAMFPTKQDAEDYIAEHFTHPTRGPSAIATEHIFFWPVGTPAVSSSTSDGAAVTPGRCGKS